MIDKKDLWEIAGRRAHLSMLGKGIIGLVGGTLVLIVTFFRKCNDRAPLESKNASQIKGMVIEPALNLDSIQSNNYYISLGVPSTDINRIVSYIKNRGKSGILIRELQKDEFNYLNDSNNYILFNKSNIIPSYYYAISLDSSDFIIGLKDSILYKVVNIPQ